MGILDFLKKDKPEEKVKAVEEKKSVVKKEEEKKPEPKKEGLVSAKKKDTRNAYKVLLKPLVTEKASFTGTYFFEVETNTNKQEVKKAFQALYGIKPKKVNIVNYGAKRVRYGKTAGNQRAWKKAIIYLKPGDNIEIYGN